MAITERLTEIKAINAMLQAVGSSPITNTEDPLNADAIMAKSSLDMAGREVQSEKWWFNTEYDFPLKRNTLNEIVLPNNIVHVDFTCKYGDYRDLSVRGTKLYDKGNHTYNFESDVVANVRLVLDFDELPEVAKLYVMIKAMRQFQDEVVGDAGAHTVGVADEERARSKVVAEDIRQVKAHFGTIPRLDPNTGFDMRNL